MQTTYRCTNDQSALVLCGNNMQLFQRDGRLARLGGGGGCQPLGSCCLQQMPYTANKVDFNENGLMDLTWQACTYLCSFGAPCQTQGDLTCSEFIMSCITEGGFKSSIEHWHLVCPPEPGLGAGSKEQELLKLEALSSNCFWEPCGPVPTSPLVPAGPHGRVAIAPAWISSL